MIYQFTLEVKLILRIPELQHLQVHLLLRRTGDFEENDEIYSHLEQHNEANSSNGNSEVFKEAKKLEAILKDSCNYHSQQH